MIIRAYTVLPHLIRFSAGHVPMLAVGPFCVVSRSSRALSMTKQVCIGLKEYTNLYHYRPWLLTENATRFCHVNGTWNHYSNYTSCHQQSGSVPVIPDFSPNVDLPAIIYACGYFISFATLVVALIIFLSFKWVIIGNSKRYGFILDFTEICAACETQFMRIYS